MDFSMVQEFGLKILNLGAGYSEVELPFRTMFSRPGGSVNGPAMMCLADYAMYLAVMTLIGPELLTVTSNLNIDFLKRPPHGRILGRARVLKLGRKLAFGRVELFCDSENGEVLVAHCTCTYSIPEGSRNQ